MSDFQDTPLAEEQDRQLIPVLPLRDVVVYPHMVIPSICWSRQVNPCARSGDGG